jgi:hypothetical protein
VLPSQGSGASCRLVDPGGQSVAVVVALAANDAGVARSVPVEALKIGAVESENAPAIGGRTLQNAGIISAAFAGFLNR